jgi:predicted nucleic acid-binding protein
VTVPIIDANLIVRLVTGDDPLKQVAVAHLFRSVGRGNLRVRIPVATVVDAVFVLTSPRMYGLDRARVSRELVALLEHQRVEMDNKPTVLFALELFGRHRIDFGDACVAAEAMMLGNGDVYSYDHDFDRIPGITRIEP